MDGAEGASRSARPGGDDRPLLRQASMWHARRRAGALTPREEAEFSAWLAADPRRREVWDEVQATWRAFDVLTQHAKSVTREPDPDLFAPPSAHGRAAHRWAMGIAAAIAMALGTFAWLRFAPLDATLISAPDEPRVTVLADGSEVELNAQTALAPAFTARERRVLLTAGEAHFTVAKDAARPFIVDTGDVTVRAIGTAFNVKLLPGALDLLVTEGTVELNHKHRSGRGTIVRLQGGERTRVALNDEEPVPPKVIASDAGEIEQLLAWQSTRLVFDRLPLSEVVARINRHTQTRAGASRLVVGDPELGALRISGRIHATNLESFIAVAESSFGVAAERRAGEIVLRRAR